MQSTKLVCILGENTPLTQALTNSLCSNNYQVVIIQHSPTLVTRNNIYNFNFNVVIDYFYSNTYLNYLKQASFIIDTSFSADITTFNNIKQKTKTINQAVSYITNNNPTAVYINITANIKQSNSPYFFKQITALQNKVGLLANNITVKTGVIVNQTNLLHNLEAICKLKKYYSINLILSQNLALALANIVLTYNQHLSKTIHLGSVDLFKFSNLSNLKTSISKINNKYAVSEFVLIKLINKIRFAIKNYYFMFLLKNLDELAVSKTIDLPHYTVKAIIAQCKLNYENQFK